MDVIVHDTVGNELKMVFFFGFTQYFHKNCLKVVFLEHTPPFNAPGRDVIGKTW
jgi:hypothetical protein